MVVLVKFVVVITPRAKIAILQEVLALLKLVQVIHFQRILLLVIVGMVNGSKLKLVHLVMNLRSCVINTDIICGGRLDLMVNPTMDQVETFVSIIQFHHPWCPIYMSHIHIYIYICHICFYSN